MSFDLKKFFDIKFLKFIIVGIANTIFGTAVMFCAYNILNLNYWISSALNYILGSILSYFLNKYFTFQNKSKNSKTIVKFIINISIKINFSAFLSSSFKSINIWSPKEKYSADEFLYTGNPE